MLKYRNDASNTSRANISVRSPTAGNAFSLQDEFAKKSFLPEAKETVKPSQVSIGINKTTNQKKEQSTKSGSGIILKSPKKGVFSPKKGVFSSTQDLKVSLGMVQQEERKPSKIISKLARELEKIQNEPHPRRTYSAMSRNSNQEASPSKSSRFANLTQESKDGSARNSKPETYRFDFNRAGGSRSSLASALSIPKLQELQDMFADLPEKEFDELPTR